MSKNIKNKDTNILKTPLMKSCHITAKIFTIFGISSV